MWDAIETLERVEVSRNQLRMPDICQRCGRELPAVFSPCRDCVQVLVGEPLPPNAAEEV